jgi:hypothetical protein
MPTPFPKDLDCILKIIERFPEGASLQDIMDSLEKPMTRRTLQRRLEHLVKNNLLKTAGSTRSRRFFVVSKAAMSSIRRPLILSPTAESIQKKISEPIQMRQYVSYNREFLDQYRPNVTYYLPATIRKHLFELGKPPVGGGPAGTYARQILSRLLIDLSWNSSRLEGNTYSLLETKRLLEWGEEAEGKNTKDAQMILNHKIAIEFLVDSANSIKFNRYTIFNLHALLSQNLLPNPKSCGALRSIPVGIAGSVYQPLAVPQLISECFQQILDTAEAITDPLEQAFFVMVHLPYLQPFEDVNKRVSRIAANLPLIRENFSPLSFVDVPEQTYINGLLGVYELNRIELLREIFIWAYEQSCALYSATRKAFGEPDPFRLRYRDLISETIGQIVRGCMNRKTTLATIRQIAQKSVSLEAQSHFIEVVEIEVMSLHEGNIARYKIRPAEYEAWHKTWQH